ncbi:MAG: 30S ribosomal protein S18 [Eubacteriales bacterium]|nr:30S ribosomal protein S18 [Eubacteriales bacterium]
MAEVENTVVSTEAPAEERPARTERTAPARRRVPRRRRKVCVFCGKESEIDYKDAAKMRRFISERGKILPRRVTGNCAKHQRAVTSAVKLARHLAILPYVED